MHDRPTPLELTAAVRHFLETELVPHLNDPRLRFLTLVAIHVLSIVERQAAVEEMHLRQEAEWLSQILAHPISALPDAVSLGNQELCQRIRAGEYDEPQRLAELLQQLRVPVERKLQVANPRYLGKSVPGA